MDTGPSSKEILHNAKRLDLNLNKINCILLSHGHYDHVNGLLGVLNSIKKPVPIIVHPKAFDPKFSYKPYLKYSGPNFSIKEIESTNGKLLQAKNHLKFINNIISTGEVQRSTTFEKVKDFWKVEKGLFIPDKMTDDQSLIINIERKGLVIIAGCAHSGIINTIKHARQITKINRIYAIIGGFHLKDEDVEKIDKTIIELGKINPNMIGPCHCTGSKAVSRFTKEFNEACKPLRVGDVLKLV
jgi:7,8-dihydropterin-6-yl-methyl-4-(beta-D-ribofuranosyl)aminobenzene 5'-phosphate synthase